MPPEIAFLENRAADDATLKRAAEQAAATGVSADRIVLDLGWISPESFYRALASDLGLTYLRDIPEADFNALARHDTNAVQHAALIPLEQNGGNLAFAAAPRGSGIERLCTFLSQHPKEKARIALTAPEAIRDGLTGNTASPLMKQAANGLSETQPEFSARKTFRLWQIFALILVAFVIGLMLLLQQVPFLPAVGWMLTAIFAATWLLRLIAALQLRRVVRTRPLANRDLPVYSVLVPIYREAKIVPRLVEALTRIDYPRSKLDILIIAEADDAETIAALEAVGMPGYIKIIKAAPGAPRTKPKALNIALQFARGSLLTIYDAEDRPDPGQLRKAAARFAASDQRLACLQASLAYENATENWLTRSFAIEYATLFDAVLPGLVRLGLPFPLGGTSNHFRIEALRSAGGWDPHNVTEDADLGIRLSRLGYQLADLDSTTLEEAPRHLGNWLAQRTRWTKGWMQTALVHSRHPFRTVRELGPIKSITLMAMIAGIVGSALLHPWCIGWLIYEFVSGGKADLLDLAIRFLATTNLLFGYATGFIAGWIGMERRGLNKLMPTLFTLPLYWLLCSLGAYRALLDLIIRPFYWDRTRHGESRNMHLPTEQSVADLVEEERYRTLRRTAAASAGSRL